MDTIRILALIGVLLSLWAYFTYMARTFPTLLGKRILLLIAHPDDEAMFFAPTVQALTKTHLGNQLKILCLSTGNADGLGETRKQELRKSAKILGVDPQNDILIVDDPNLQDGKPWSAQMIARSLVNAVVPDLSRTPSSKPLKTMVDIIITFDQYGVSGHTNHKSCYEGAELLLAELKKGRGGWEVPVTIYALRSVNIVRKYSHIFDAVLTTLWTLLRLVSMGGGKPRKKKRDSRGKENEAPPNPKLLFAINGVFQWNRAQKAMVSGHWSQMVWFRWGWIGLGRYLVVNDLRQVKPV